MRPRRARPSPTTLAVMLTAAIATVLSLALAAPASAHVSVVPSEAPRGGFAKLTFRVPAEHATASTISVEVNFPTDHPIASARTKPVPGWTAKVDKTAVAVTKITWSGGKIAPGEFQEFDVSLRLPEQGDSIAFPSVQTYDNGDVVRWIEGTDGGGEEPEHPAPVLTLTEGEGGGDGDGGGHGEAPAVTTVPADPTGGEVESGAGANEDGDDDDSDVLPIVAIVVSLLAVALSVVALTRRR